MAKKQKYYVVWEGNNPGIYDSWTACQLQIKGYPNAKYKSFTSRAEAEAAFHGGSYEHLKAKVADKPSYKSLPENVKSQIIWESIAVDAACSGNPGVMEYRGVETKTGRELFRQGPFQDATNNIGEFLAIVHALAQFQKEGDAATPIYSDSRTAMAWIRKKKAKTTLHKTRRNATVFQLIARAEKWLKENTFMNQIIKWDTEKWGEIPADFGRK